MYETEPTKTGKSSYMPDSPEYGAIDNLYDKEEIFPNCTVQVWTNTKTGKVSIGWWPND